MIEDIKMLIKSVKGNPRLLLLGDGPQPSHTWDREDMPMPEEVEATAGGCGDGSGP